MPSLAQVSAASGWRASGGLAGLWPQPMVVQSGKTEAGLLAKAFEVQTQSTSAVLKNGIRRYWPALFSPFQPQQQQLQLTLVVSVVSDADGREALNLQTDETYFIYVPEPFAGIPSASLSASRNCIWCSSWPRDLLATHTLE